MNSEQEPLNRRLALKAILEFKQSDGYRLFQEDIGEAVKMGSRALCEAAPASIQDFVLREQGVGQLEQLHITLEWFDVMEEQLKEELKEINED